MQRGDVEHHAIVEVGFQMQVGRPTQFVFEVPQFGEKVFLPFGVLARFAGGGLFAVEGFETGGFQADLRLDVLVPGR
jgi:hypothetical protein